MGAQWDRRYRDLGATFRAAMFKSLPDSLNGYLHDWQMTQLRRAGLATQRKRFLDAGCGYGRLALPLAHEFPGFCGIGSDRSEIAIGLYNARLSAHGFGCVSDLRRLPFADASFDLVVMVTSLMYLSDPAQQSEAISELARVMRRDGRGIVIENNRVGGPLSTLLGALARIANPRWSISAATFDSRQIPQLLTQAGATVMCRTGCPIFTWALPFLLLAARWNRLFNSALRACQTLDYQLSWWSGASLYVAFEFRKGS